MQLDHVDELVDVLTHQYFEPKEIPPFIEICSPVDGASILEIPEIG